MWGVTLGGTAAFLIAAVILVAIILYKRGRVVRKRLIRPDRMGAARKYTYK